MYGGVKSLSARYAEKYDITKKEAERRLKEILIVMEEELLDDNDGIQFIDFFTLRKKDRKPKVGRNPASPKDTFKIPARLDIKCELGDRFKAELNK